MAEYPNSAPRDQESRESSVFEPPQYSITHGPDHTLQWDPAADSEKLAIALSYHFPKEKTLQSKMQAAMKRFLKAETKKMSKKAVVLNDPVLRQEIITPNTTNSTTTKEESGAINPNLQPKTGDSKPGGSNGTHDQVPHDELSALTQSTSEDQTQHSNSDRNATTLNSSLKFVPWDPEARAFKEKAKRRRLEKEEEAPKVAANRGKVCEKHRRQKVKVCQSPAVRVHPC